MVIVVFENLNNYFFYCCYNVQPMMNIVLHGLLICHTERGSVEKVCLRSARQVQEEGREVQGPQRSCGC